jgi:uncharacterized protein (DUF2141 family)
MKIATFLIAASAIFASAEAQDVAGMEFLPIPDDPPAYLFAPGPLSGSMLKPFVGPTPRTGADIAPEPGPAPSVVARMHTETPEAFAPATPPAPAEAATAMLEEEQPVAEPAPPAAIVPPAAAKPTTGTVTVIVENVESPTGTINVAVCDKGLSREGCPYSHEIPVSGQGFVETEFDNIPPGNYAVVGYHDVNGNNEFDKLFGMPREPYALSSRAADKLVPTFNDAALPISAGPNSVIIRLKRLGG